MLVCGVLCCGVAIRCGVLMWHDVMLCVLLCCVVFGLVWFGLVGCVFVECSCLCLCWHVVLCWFAL